MAAVDAQVSQVSPTSTASPVSGSPSPSHNSPSTASTSSTACAAEVVEGNVVDPLATANAGSEVNGPTPPDLSRTPRLDKAGPPLRSTSIGDDELAERLQEGKPLLSGEATPHPSGIKYWWWHPWTRICVILSLPVLNSWIYLEDPSVDSFREATLPVVGALYSLLRLQLTVPDETADGELTGEADVLLWDLWLWRAGLLVVLIVYTLVGGFFLQRFLHKHSRMEIFRGPYGDDGTLPCCLVCLLSGAAAITTFWNMLLSLMPAHEHRFQLVITDGIGINEKQFGRLAQSACGFGDMITMVMVFDMMMQHPTFYQGWLKACRSWYNRTRVWAVWLVFFGCLLPTLYFIWKGRDAMYLNSSTRSQMDLSLSNQHRAILAGLILCLDLVVVAQDWDFPRFDNGMEVNVAGMSTSRLHFPALNFHIAGKWMNYGILIFVMFFDFIMVRNHLTYVPHDHGQYMDHTARLWTVRNEADADFVAILGHVDTMGPKAMDLQERVAKEFEQEHDEDPVVMREDATLQLGVDDVLAQFMVDHKHVKTLRAARIQIMEARAQDAFGSFLTGLLEADADTESDTLEAEADSELAAGDTEAAKKHKAEAKRDAEAATGDNAEREMRMATLRAKLRCDVTGGGQHELILEGVDKDGHVISGTGKKGEKTLSEEIASSPDAAEAHHNVLLRREEEKVTGVTLKQQAEIDKLERLAEAERKEEAEAEKGHPCDAFLRIPQSPALAGRVIGAILVACGFIGFGLLYKYSL